MIDSRSRKATENTSLSGYDAGIRIKGCKRHIITDTCGNLIAGEAHGTNIQDRDGAPVVMTRHHREAPKPRRMFAPGGYGGPTLRGVATRPLIAAGGDCRSGGGSCSHGPVAAVVWPRKPSRVPRPGR